MKPQQVHIYFVLSPTEADKQCIAYLYGNEKQSCNRYTGFLAFCQFNQTGAVLTGWYTGFNSDEEKERN